MVDGLMCDGRFDTPAHELLFDKVGAVAEPKQCCGHLRGSVKVFVTVFDTGANRFVM